MAGVEVRPSPIHGQGLFALRDFSRGEIILPIDDSRVVTPDSPLREDRGEFEDHCDYLAGGRVVLLRPPERHMNHSCKPNSFVRTINGVRYKFALCHIPAGEEITNDYCINSRGDTVWECNYCSDRCRRAIHSDFFRLPLSYQKEYLALLEEWFIRENPDEIAALIRLIQTEGR